MAAVRECIVSVRDSDGLTHTVTVHATTLFEAGAAAVDAFQQQNWAATALTPNAVLRVEVRAPAVHHEVPLKSVERWRNAPSTSPEGVARETRSLITSLNVRINSFHSAAELPAYFFRRFMVLSLAVNWS